MKALWFTVAVIVAVVVAIGAYVYKNNQSDKPGDNTSQTQTPPPPPSSKPTPPPSVKPTPPPPPPASLDDSPQPTPPPATKPDDDGVNSGTDVDQNNGTTWTGTLKASDKAAIGNLMLIQSDTNKTIYINTSRDYSALIGEEVIVTYDGTINDFTLVSIVKK